MTSQQGDVFELLRKIRYDCTAIQAKVTDCLNLLATFDIPDVEQVECPRCGLPCRGPQTLSEHLYVSHDGPLPAQYARVDALVGEPS